VRRPPCARPDYFGRISADRQLIDRWLDGEWLPDDSVDVEAIWKRLKSARPEADAASFIKAVLFARRSAGATVNRVYGATWDRGEILGRKTSQKIIVPGFNDEWPRALQNLKKKLKALSAGPSRPPLTVDPLEVADFLEWAAADIGWAAVEIRFMHARYFGIRTTQNLN